MKFTRNDLVDTERLAEVVRRIDQLDTVDANKVTDEIFQRQPFFLSVLMGYHFGVSVREMEEIIRMYLLIWEYFRPNKRVQSKQITQGDYEKIQARNIQMLKYSEGEFSEKGKRDVFTHDLQRLKSKPLWAAILFRFEHRPVLKLMDTQTKGMVLIGMKSFIECFESI